MNIKKVIIFFILVFTISELYAQHKRINEKSAILIKKNISHKLIIIHEKEKIRYWCYNSDKSEEGRIQNINYNSIIVNGKEIKLDSIRKIGVRKGSTTPLIIPLILITPIAFFITPPLIALVLSPNINRDLTKKWKITGTYLPVIDSSRLAHFKKIEKLQFDTSSSFIFSLNPLNCLLNQYTLDIGYQKKHNYLGIGGGIVKANCWWNQNHNLYDGTDNDFQLGFYNGWLLSMDYKRLNINRRHWYFETNLFFKYLYYDHVHFNNTFGDDDPDIEWIQSEIVKVYGIKFIMGKRIYKSNHFAIEPFFGASLRFRNISCITSWQNRPDDKIANDPLGILVNDIELSPGLQAGLLLTFGHFKAK